MAKPIKFKAITCSQNDLGETICEIAEHEIFRHVANTLTRLLHARIKKRLPELRDSMIELSGNEIFERKFNVGLFNNEETCTHHSNLEGDEISLGSVIREVEIYSHR